MDRLEDEILWDIVEEHLDEAEFLWASWERGLMAPHLTLAELTVGAEARLQAHIQGLAAAAPAVLERVLAPALHDYQRDRAAAAAWAWLVIEGDRAVGPLCEHLMRADPPECRGIARALGLFDGDIVGHVAPLLRAESSAVQAAALTIFAAHRRSPGPVLAELAEEWFHGPETANTSPQRLACVAFGVPRALQAGLMGELGDAGFESGLWTGLRCGFMEARDAAWRATQQRSATLVIGAIGGDRGLRALLAGLSDHPEAALWGLGFTGRRAAADACGEWLGHVKLGPLAAESLAAITGLDMDSEGMTVRPLRDEDEDDDDIPAVGIDDGLRRPDPERARAWWQANRGRFEPHQQRYFYGVPATAAGMTAALERASMRRRPGLTFELAMRTRGQVNIDPRWFTWRQREAMMHAGTLRIDPTAGHLE